MSPHHVYVAVDLETTGFSAQQDAIIEIGAVRFACDPLSSGDIEVLDRFVTFVNPGRTIPLRIQQLTGISDADVAVAPTLEEVAPDLIGFVGSETQYTVAHNASFDGGFLLAGGIDFHRPMQDTFELATIFLPGAPSYSLGELARTLQIPLPDAHRALDDAEATARLFGLLLERMAALPPAIGRTLRECGRECNWKPLFLLADLDPGNRSDNIEAEATSNPHMVSHPQRVASAGHVPAASQGPLSPTTLEDVSGFFAPEGHLNTLLGPTYEIRPGQVEMSERVMEALRTGDHLLIEAGTGTGKTLAYLLPTAMYALAHDDRAVVATNTIALQDQLLEKELPLVQELLTLSKAGTLDYAVLKGRSNYLCTRRLHLWYRNRRLKAEELSLLAKVFVWLQYTETGDVAELFMPSPAERAMWHQINSSESSCSPERCSERCNQDRSILGQRCRDFFYQARHEADAAHVLIVNHALLLTDMLSGGRILPPYRNLVIDEAHRLEESATEAMTYHADWNVLIRWLQELEATGNLFRRVTAVCEESGDLECRSEMFSIASVAAAAISAVSAFADALLSFLLGHSDLRTESVYTQRIALDAAARSQPAWSELEIAWDIVSQSLTGLVARMQKMIAMLKRKRWSHSEPHASLLSALTSISEEIDAMAKTVDQIAYGTGDVQNGKLVTWAEVDDRPREARLVCAPMFVSDTLESGLIHRKRSVILTGATLRTGSGFSFIRDRLGLWDVAASTVDSPFDYKRSTLLFMPSDIPDPRTAQYQKAVENAIVSSALAAEGATVALFTSYAQLRATADAIRAPLDQAGITVLQHGFSSRRRLLREYRQTEKAVLLGTRTFWEGIDLPGDELLCLLIVRLPFAVPSDPLVAARTDDLENAFRDYTLPDAILRFRQGFGRLIRRASDRGVVVLLDNRLWRKEYGRAFLESLPQCTQKHAPLDTLHNEARRWLMNDQWGSEDGLL